MNTKGILGLIVAVIVIGGGAWYFSSQKTTGGDAMKADGDQKESATGAGTFADLVGRVGSWKCEVTSKVEEAPSVGTAYIANGKVRADFTSTPSALGGKEVTSHMISADGYVYTWSDAYSQGMKMVIPEGEASVDTSASAGVGLDSRVEYSCGPWATDASVFSPPASVSFMELGKDGMPAGMPTGY